MTEGSLNPSPGTPEGDLAERIQLASLGVLELLSIRHGHELGFYRALAIGPLTTAELATTTGTDQRMVTEWCEQQAVAGYLVLADGRFALTPATAIGFVDESDLSFAVGSVLEALHAVKYLPQQETAFRTGAGMDRTHPWVGGRPDTNRPKFLRLMGTWMSAAPAVHQRLSAPARVADLGVGSGWSSIALALTYPQITVDGFDLDPDAITYGVTYAAEQGVSHRVRLLARDAGDIEFAGQYDLVTVFEALHDMSHPVDVLSSVRAMLADGGSVLIADERARDELITPGTPFDRLLYGWSLASCLPRGMAVPGSAATGTVMRPDTLRRYAAAAGFSRVEILPIEHHEWRFYQLLP